MQEQSQSPTPTKRRRRKNTGKWLTLILVILVLGWGGMKMLESSKYHAVLLVNGQAYFGKIRNLPLARTINLRNVYYLQVNQAAESDPNQPPLTLVRRGREIHAPENNMTIPKNQILFWEKLRSNSKVLELIQSFQNAN